MGYGGYIWCPADTKNSNVLQGLYNAGFSVTGTHIDFGHDFLTTTPPDVHAIITNPPYTLKNEFLERAIQLRIPFAFLLPLDAITSIKRTKLYKGEDIGFLVYDKRIDFTGKKSPHFHNIWVLGNFNFKGRIEHIQAESYL